MLIHLADAQARPIAIDYRETAPAATTRDMFLDAAGRGRSAQVARHAALAVGVPGTVAGLALAHRALRLGQVHARRLDRARDRARARRHSGRGRPRRFAAARAAAARALAGVAQDLPQAPTAARWRAATAGADATSPRTLDGDRAATGRAPSTTGAIADKIAAAVRAAGGLMTARRSRRLSRRSSARRCAAPIAATTSSRCRRRPPAACI